MRASLDQIVIDSRRPDLLVRFWAALLDGEPVDRAHGWSHVKPPGFPAISFQPVAEDKTVKNRLHLDIDVDSIGIEAAVGEAVALGAVRVGEVVADEKCSFQVMRDPEGNEFCFVAG